MPKPRKALVSLEATPYYHCVSRCVRRAFLCGEDTLSGQSYEHRRKWIRECMLSISRVFAIDICAYAVMSNHYHVVLRVDREQAEGWEDREAIERWHQLFSGPPHPSLSSWRYPAEGRAEGGMRTGRPVALATDGYQLDMRCLNEAIARQANEEDNCTGRFWEGRFKSQALLDEKALAACMAYVDLNPVRAGMADTPEKSEFTTIQERIKRAVTGKQTLQPTSLMPFVGNPREGMPKGLPFRFADYLELVDWTGRAIRKDKRGAIPDNLPPVLERLQIDPRYWL